MSRRPGLDRLSGSEVAAIVDLYQSLYRPEGDGEVPSAAIRSSIVDQFHRLYYHDGTRTWRATRYRGVPIKKCPLDLWIYQEIVHDLRPELIVETGTADGGSAFFFGDLCDTVGSGRVVSVDIDASDDRPRHDRVTYATGSSTDPAVVDQVRSMVPDLGPVLVVLDSDHARPHVQAELEAYAPFVTVGSYLVVEDTDINGHPVLPSFGEGPMEAVESFVSGRSDFVIDASREKFMVTFNPSGYLLRVGQSN